MPPSTSKAKRSAFDRIASTLRLGGSADTKIKMPGKSNKFDLTNRANSGVKLGEIISTSLQKEAEKIKKDAERQVAKARKQSSSSSSNVVPEQASTVHPIDLKVPNKDLGDDGVFAMADGMETALESGTAEATLALEDLNLSGNKLTTVSLARLAPIIKLAKFDLKTINLSNNNIQVVNDEEAEQWEAFLLSFKDCMKLRRLDLSDNPWLGSRALEVLARVHANERAITPIPHGGNMSVLSLVSESGENDDDSSELMELCSDDELPRADKMSAGTFIKRRCGLRSIPYVTLHNIGLTDAGALWLSYVLEDHYYPSQLIDELNATNAESIIKAYQQNTHSHGIDWAENKQVGKEGAQILERTEILREHRLHDQGVGAADLLDIDEEIEPVSGLKSGTVPRTKAGNRRGSMRSINTADGGEHEVSELESARKKIMRHIIGHEGIGGVELWTSTYEIFWASRRILLLAPSIRKHHTGEPLFATDDPVPPATKPPTRLDSPVRDAGSGWKVDTDRAKAAGQTLRASYASTLSATSDSALTEVTNAPSTPLRFQRPTHRKGAFSAGKDVEAVTGKLSAVGMRDNSPLRFVRYQKRRIAAAEAEGKVFRDRLTLTQLPTSITERIVTLVVNARALEVGDGEQRARAIARGQDRGSLMAEREWLKKDRSAQVLMLLDSVQCLHYGQ